MAESTDPWRELEDQLAELNALANERLHEPRHPEPAGLPARGSWIRAIDVDDDGHAKPLTPWHLVVGWDAQIGTLSTRCRRRSHRVLQEALEGPVVGRGRQRWGRAYPRARLLVSPGAPAETCRQCEFSLAREAKRAAAEQAAAAESAFLGHRAAIEDLALAAIDDAERGRLLRELLS